MHSIDFFNNSRSIYKKVHCAGQLWSTVYQDTRISELKLNLLINEIQFTNFDFLSTFSSTVHVERSTKFYNYECLLWDDALFTWIKKIERVLRLHQPLREKLLKERPV